jgi:two-component system response regulator YesN
MKIKMVVIDDELLVRKGIISSVDWEREGIEIAGEAADGRSGLELIREVQPDLVLTDIKMPYMDGLEMIKTVRAEYPLIRIVILSVLEDFHTVREALKLGAVDYMNKFLMGPDELLQSVCKIKQSILQSPPQAATQSAAVKPAGHLVNMDWIRWIKGESNSALDGFIEQSGSYAVAVLEFRNADGAAGGQPSEDDIRAALDRAFRDDKDLEYKALFEAGSSWTLFCHTAPGATQAAQLLYDRLAAWNGIGRAAPSAGISLAFTNGEQRTQAYLEAQSALQTVFCKGNGIYLYQSRIPTPSGAMPPFAKAQALKHYLLQLEGYDEENAAHAFHDLFPESLDDALEKALVVDAIHAWVSAVILLLKDWGGQLPVNMQKESLFEHVHNLKTYADLREWCFYLHQLVRETLTQLKSAHHRTEIQRAMEYMKTHYQTPIRVQDVAQHVNLSENYFSNVFTKETGKTFSQYIQELRIDKAKELLRAGKHDWIDVGELVGMDNPKYFAKVFKKYTGITPVRYRSVFK